VQVAAKEAHLLLNVGLRSLSQRSLRKKSGKRPKGLKLK
jgi:hypothetical protein